jgi:hypothetical protein
MILTHTLGDRLLAVAATNTNTVYNVSLFGLVSKAAGFVGARWSGGAVDDTQLSVFPTPMEYLVR